MHSPDGFGAPAKSITVSDFGGVDGFLIADTLTGTQTASFNVSYTSPAITLQDSEFPQIDSFTGNPKSWSVGAGGMTIPITCGANTGAPSANPCTEGVPVNLSIN